jgi:hypothetical protein
MISCKYKEALKDLVEYVDSAQDRNVMTCSECREAFRELGWDCEHFNKCPEHPALVIARDLVNGNV